jgi:type I site-specific restriction endonuclease
MLAHLVPLHLPKPQLKLAKRNQQPYVWDVVRKKYLLLTPEEWVRQHWVHLLQAKGYPLSNIQLEGGFAQNNLRKRSDILVYKQAKPFLLVECKSPQVPISQATMDQAAQYNLHYKAPFIALSNGLTHYCAEVSPTPDSESQGEKQFQFIHEIPSYH